MDATLKMGEALTFETPRRDKPTKRYKISEDLIYQLKKKTGLQLMKSFIAVKRQFSRYTSLIYSLRHCFLLSLPCYTNDRKVSCYYRRSTLTEIEAMENTLPSLAVTVSYLRNAAKR